MAAAIAWPVSQPVAWSNVQDVGEVHAGGLVREMWEPQFERRARGRWGTMDGEVGRWEEDTVLEMEVSHCAGGVAQRSEELAA